MNFQNLSFKVDDIFWYSQKTLQYLNAALLKAAFFGRNCKKILYLFKFNIIFNNNGETFEKILERAFGNYCIKRN